MTSAWVTLATNDGYAVGALVLAHSLKLAGTQHKLHILYTSGVSNELKAKLEATFDASTLVDVLDSKDESNLALIGRPDLGVTFTKLHCWKLTQYQKAVFLDADTLVLKNADELFERPELAAAADIGWPDYFNSGVFVFVPSDETYNKLVAFGVEHGTFDGGDQGLLNEFFSGWRDWSSAHRLPFIYNVTSGAIYSYAAALKKRASDIKIVHFLGAQKPWHQAGGQTHVTEHLAYWQQLYRDHVLASLPAHLVVGFDDLNPLESNEFYPTSTNQLEEKEFRLFGSGFPPPRLPLHREHRNTRHRRRHHDHHHHSPQHHQESQSNHQDQLAYPAPHQTHCVPIHREEQYRDAPPEHTVHEHHDEHHHQGQHEEQWGNNECSQRQENEDGGKQDPQKQVDYFSPSEPYYESRSHGHQHLQEEIPQYETSTQNILIEQRVIQNCELDSVSNRNTDFESDHTKPEKMHESDPSYVESSEGAVITAEGVTEPTSPSLRKSQSTTSISSFASSTSSSDESKFERHYEEWDRGAIDYTGRDAFDNIQKQIERALNE